MRHRKLEAGLILALAGIALVCATPDVALAQTFTEYPIPTGASRPWWITLGPDGAMWFTERDGNKIGRIDAAGTITEFPIPTFPSSPEGIVLGPDGNLWFTESYGLAGQKIGRITTAGTITEFNGADSPRPITVGPDANLWYGAGNSSSPKLGRVTTSGAITEFPFQIPGGLVLGIVTGPDANLWFSMPIAGAIGRMTPTGDFTPFPLTPPSGASSGITVGSDGNLWFTGGSGNQICRMTTAGVVTNFPVPTAASYPYAIASAEDGMLWFTERDGNKIASITTSGVVTEYPIPTAASNPRGIAIASDGSIWFTEYDRNKIGRLDPNAVPTATPTPTQTPTPTPSIIVSAIAPRSALASGGTPVVISGTGFLPGASLTIGGVMAESVLVVSSTEIDATTPALTPGTLNDVLVTNPESSRGLMLDSGSLERGWLADFLDVAQDDIFHDYIETIFRDGITAGYGNGYYGRDDAVTRAQMAVFLLKGEHGSSYVPPACVGVFEDVACTPGIGFPDWIERLYAESITSGCLTDPLRYCPDRAVTRAEMAVFLLKAEHGPGYVPPSCVGIFADVPCVPGVGFADWIEKLYGEGITAGCNLPGDPPTYCPDDPNTRGQMAVFLVKTFGLE